MDPDEKLKLNEHDSINLNFTLTSPKTLTEITTKAYIVSLHDENERNRGDLGLSFYDEETDQVKNNQDKDFNEFKLTNLDSLTVNRDPSSDNQISRKKHFDNDLDKNFILSFYQTLENYLNVFLGKDTYILTKHDKIQIIDTTLTKQGNDQYLLPRWKVICNDKNKKIKMMGQQLLFELQKQQAQLVNQE